MRNTFGHVTLTQPRRWYGVDWNTISGAIGGLAAAFGGVRRFVGKADRKRAQISRDVELRDRLADGSTARTELERYIEQSVRELVELQQDSDRRRTDPYGLIWMVVFLGIAVGAGATAVRTHYAFWIDALLWVVVGAFLLLTLVGATVTFRQPPKAANEAGPI